MYTPSRRTLAASKLSSPISFTTTLHQPVAESLPPGTSPDFLFLRLPAAASKKLPSRSQVSVRGRVNGHAFQSTLEPDGEGGHWLRIEPALRSTLALAPGDAVAFQITPLTPDEEPEPVVPADLASALQQASIKARATWTDITPLARRDWIHWITSGKKAATRATRIATACDMLAKGKRRACCFDRSGMYSKTLSCPTPAAPPARP